MGDIVRRTLWFDRYALDLTRGSLRLADRDLALRPKAFMALRYLVENAGRLVAKDELQRAVWRDVIVTDDSLVQCVRQLRQTLDDHEHRLIKTVSRRGYLLDAQVFDHDPKQEMSDQSRAASGQVGRRPVFDELHLASRESNSSIAVLPFLSTKGDPEQEYFADGIVEDIITALSRFKSLFVIAHNSSFTYKGKAIDLKKVGRELGVRYVLEGSVRRAAGKVRITGRLIDSDTGAHLWADRFDGAIEDIFELQDQVAARVVGAIAPKITQAEIERAKRRSVLNVDAYDSYLRGLGHLQEVSRASCAEALRLFNRAIELDPDFPTPYGMVARCYVTHKGQGWVVSKEQEEAEIQRLASSVAIVGRDDALALSWVGFSLVWNCREYDTGSALVDQALAINPNLAVGWINRGFVSAYVGEHEGALLQLGNAMRLSPMDPETYRTETGMALAQLLRGKYDEALTWTSRALARQPNWRAAVWVAACASALAGRIDEARNILERLRQRDRSVGFTDVQEFITLRRRRDVDRILEGFRLAGLSARPGHSEGDAV
jgi:TolB-like protein